MRTQKRVQSVVFLLLFFYIDRHLSVAEHHPFCQASCAGLKLRSSRTSCLMSCDQDLAAVFYRAGREPYLGLLPAGSFAVDNREDGDAIELPLDEVIVREPRDRSAFVRIGKRDVSAQTKRRDEFVRIGKGIPMHPNRSPFLIGRSFDRQTGMDDEEQQLQHQIEERTDPRLTSPDDNALLVPLSDTNKRPSAFVRIGRNDKDDSEGQNALDAKLASSSAATGGNLEFVGEGPTSGADETGDQLDKKASAFVRIGRKGKGASFVRIGKSDPNMKK